jgi:acyl-CoA hydrolase
MSLIPKLLISHKINSITGIKLIPSNLGAVLATVPVKVKCTGRHVGKIPYTVIDINTIKIIIMNNILFFITFIIFLLLD